MRRFIPYILKTLWRHRTRTLLTVSGTAMALFVFSFVAAVQEGLERLTHDQASDRTLIVFQANRFCPSTSKLPEDYVRRISKLPGVREAVPIKVYMNNCRASLDVVVFNGIPATQLKAARDIKLTKGDWGQFERQRDSALVGRAVAHRRHLDVGQRFSIGMLTVTVSGIFESAMQSDENMIYTHLEFLQRTKGLNSVGTVTQIEVPLSPDADPKSICKAIDQTFLGGPIGTNTRTKGVFQAKAVGDLVELIGFMRLLGYACVGLVLTLVSTTTIMGVQDRVKEHAVLQTIGCTGYQIFGLVMSESVIISTIGGLLGVAVAMLTLQFSGLALGAEGVMIAFQPSVSIALTGAVLAMTVGFIAGIVPGWQAARADIVTALRFA
jgi:putative ABC transport system permease protein